MNKTLTLCLLFSLLSFSCKAVDAPFAPTAQDSIIDKKAQLQQLWAGGVFTEGPTIDTQGNVLFTDIRVNLIKKYDIKSGTISTYRKNSNGANGLKFHQGKLYSCEGAGLQYTSVAVTDSNGKKTVLADRFQNKKFNGPNDLCIANNGDIYFTDPCYGSTKNKELDFEGVFLIRQGKVILASKETERPNGILLSLDGQSIYIADNNNKKGGARSLLKFNIAQNGTLINKKVLFSFKDNQRGIDGMAMDSEGNIYATAGLGADSGIYVFSPSGDHLAFIAVPELPTNCTFGGPQERNILYITCKVEPKSSKNKKFGLFKIALKKSAQ